MGKSLQRFCLFQASDYGTVQKAVRDIIHDFDNLPITDEKKPRVGIVGEILVKFLPAANNHLVDLLESGGAEAVMPDLIDFFALLFLQHEL